MSLRDERERLQGQTIVRRFTGELEGKNTLEKATISAQKAQDDAATEQRDAHLRSLFDDRGGNDEFFHLLEAKRLALTRTLAQLEAPQQQSTLVRVGIHRKSAKTSATEAVRSRVTHGFEGLENYINDLQKNWRAGQGEPARRFRSLCSVLNDHKAIFAIIPSQNDYAATLCGSISMLVGAAVNHDEVAEIISETVADITRKAGQAAKALLLINSSAIRQLFSKLYADTFTFYQDVIEWFLKSKTSRFIGSFNSNLKTKYIKAVANINELLTELYHEAQLATLFHVKKQQTERERQEDLFNRRQQSRDSADLVAAGQNMQVLLLISYKGDCIEASKVRRITVSRGMELVASFEKVNNFSNVWDRATARAHTADLGRFVHGTESHSIFNQGLLWLPEVSVSSEIRNWIGNVDLAPTMWISSPEASWPDVSSSHTAALNLLMIAWQAEMPVISHFCERPRYGHFAADRDVEKVGLLGLMYSLIIQLLQFGVDNDKFNTSADTIERLDGSDESWATVLDWFSALLEATSYLGFCIVDGLNELAFDSGANWCNDFLDRISNHQKSSTNTFRLLLTTSGASRVLPERIDAADHLIASGTAREAAARGQWVGQLSN